MNLKLWFSLVFQRVRENPVFVHSGLFALLVLGFVSALMGNRTKATRLLSQAHRTARLRWMKRLVEPYVSSGLDTLHVAASPLGQSAMSPLFGKRLLVLKPPISMEEKGVLLVAFTETIRLLHSCVDLQKLMNDYTLLLEPSWSGYCYPELLDFARRNQETFVFAAEQQDFDFLKRMGRKLVPVPLGPCDWVDPRLAEPYLGTPKNYDIIVNSTWAAWKRHYVLFRMLARAEQKYKVALIGVEWDGRTRSDIERMADFYRVRDQITLLEHVPYAQVMDIMCRCKVSLLLSLKEGSNRALAESMFCNVPVVALSTHVGGIRKNIVPETGMFASERTLESSINYLSRSALAPRTWAVEHISCFVSSGLLNTFLRNYSVSAGKQWTRDLVERSNSPEPNYVSETDKEQLASWNDDLLKYLKAHPDRNLETVTA
ncbi:MAG TPA: glycosyltransferase [Candidatus Acidoferrales bacterium]|nr:glycosyltransferase [Candidatus Acidoferrales bacterium]